MLIILVLFVVCAVAIKSGAPPDLSYCSLNTTTRRLTSAEWNACGPRAMSEFGHNITGKDQRKRVSVPMRVSTPQEWAACPHQREDAVWWAVKYADIDQDGLICWEEVAELKNDLLTTVEKIYLLFSAPDLIMKHCSGDDGYITEADFETYKTTCLRNCESVLNFFEYFADRAVAKKNYRPKPVKCSAKKSPKIIEEGKAALLHRQDLYKKPQNKD